MELINNSSIFNSVVYNKGHCGFCKAPSMASVFIKAIDDSCELCNDCMKKHCESHGTDPIQNGFYCHSCTSLRKCRNKGCPVTLFRGPLKQKYCTNCIASVGGSMIITLSDDESDDEEMSEDL